METHVRLSRDQEPPNMAASSAGGRRGQPELRNRKLKDKAVAFYSQHDVSKSIERLLNEMFPSPPPDIYGYMSEYFHSLSKEPVISNLTTCEVLDSSGGQAIAVQVYCIVNGVEKLISSTSVPMELYPSGSDSTQPPVNSPKGKGTGIPKGKGSKISLQKPPEKDSEINPQSSESSLTERYLDPIDGIRQHIGPAVKGLAPKNQKEMDEVVARLNPDDGELKLHLSSLQAASYSIAEAAATLLKEPLYCHLAKTYSPDTQKYPIPIPVASIITSGRAAVGKLRFREFCLTPLPGIAFSKQVRALMSVYQEVGKALSAKTGPSALCCHPSTGGYCPVIDKPELALDLLREATAAAGLQLNNELAVIIDVGADRVYDQEKRKYEIVAGQWKGSGDLIGLYSDLLSSYPGLIGYVDPLHHQDVEGWLHLQERLGSKCLLIADSTLEGLRMKGRGEDRAVKEEISSSEVATEVGKDEDKTKETSSGSQVESSSADEPGISYLSCASFPVTSTLSEAMQRAAHLRGHSHYIMLSAPPNLTVNTVLADLAVAIQARFLRMGAPVGLTSSAMLSRLLYISEELVTKKLHEPPKAHLFTCTPATEEQSSSADNTD